MLDKESNKKWMFQMNELSKALVQITELIVSPQRNGFPVLIAIIGLAFAYFGYDLFQSGIQEGGAALSFTIGEHRSFNLGKGGPGLIFCLFGMGLILFATHNYSKLRAAPSISIAEDKNGLIEIEPRKITKEFDELLASANRWRYKGNFGRYMRGKVLPTLASKSNLHITACLIDPTILELCQKHAYYRNNINSIDKGKHYDASAVALEVIVTIVICAWYVANKRTTIELYLSPVFDPVRIDANDDAMILTVEDRRSSALKITKEHFTFEHFDLQMQFSRQQAKRVNLEGMQERRTIADVEAGDVENLLKQLNMTELLNTLGAEKILLACKEARNPYES